MYKSISYSHFARLTGTSEGAVRKAIVRGSISKGVDLSLKKINAYIASKEWGKPILKEFLSESVEIKKPVAKKPASVKPIPVPKKPKKEAETIEEFMEEIMHEKLPSADADDLADETVSADLDGYIDKPEAERVTAVLKAKILQIAYRERQGQLVPIDKVNSVLFGYGQEIRNAVEGITNRCIDNILSSKTRQEAKRLLDDEIYNTLKLLSDISDRGI